MIFMKIFIFKIILAGGAPPPQTPLEGGRAAYVAGGRLYGGKRAALRRAGGYTAEVGRHYGGRLGKVR